MKKIIAFMMAAVMAVSMVACGGGESAPAYDVNEVLAKIEEVAPVRMAAPMEDEYMEFLGITSDMFDDYAGSFCMVSPGVDAIAVVLAKDGKVEDVKAALQAQKDYLATSNSNYNPVYTEACNEGRLVVKGNYVVLVIHCGDEETFDKLGADQIYAPIDAAIEEAFK